MPDWTQAQEKAIGHYQNDLLVKAGAGSGKTAVLAQRCCALVTADDNPCDVSQLLVVTFTEEAANEMRSRIATAIREKAKATNSPRLRRQAMLVDQARISTIHGFCAWVIRTYFDDSGLDPSFSVLGEHEALLLFDEIYSQALAHWLKRTDDKGKEFQKLFDVYANGKSEWLQTTIKKLRMLLATESDSAGWLTKVRSELEKSPAQIVAGLAGIYAKEMNELATSLAKVGEPPADATKTEAEMYAWLAKVRQFAAAHSKLLMDDPAIWDQMASALNQLQSDQPKRVQANAPQAERDKKAFYEPAKEQVKDWQMCFAITRNDLIANEQSIARHLRSIIDFTAELETRYSIAKQNLNKLDFNDLESYALKVLCNADSRAARELKSRFKHIMIDEYQDTNPLQEILLGTLRCGAASFFTVGDVQQSIYGFRGSEPSLFENRASRLAAESPDGVIEMAENFRTHPSLIQAINLICSSLGPNLPNEAAFNYGKLRAGRTDKPADATKHAPCEPDDIRAELVVLTPPDANRGNDQQGADESNNDEQDDGGDSGGEDDLTVVELEAKHIAERLTQLVATKPIIFDKDKKTFRRLVWGDIAILLRSPRGRADVIVKALLNAGIPAVADLRTGYLESVEIQQALALLEVLDNPNQDIPLAALLTGPVGRFTHDELAIMREYARSYQLRAAFHEIVFHLANLDSTGIIETYLKDVPLRLRALFARLDQWRQDIRTLGLPDALARIFDETGLLVYSAGLPGGTQCVANLNMLRQRAMEFAGFNQQGLFRFLEFLRRLGQSDIDLGAAVPVAPGNNAVRIMSIHASKGLEFPVVVLAGLGAQVNMRDTQSLFVVDRALGLGLKLISSDGKRKTGTLAHQTIKSVLRKRRIEEEARLLYVAMTRAREWLILIGVNNVKSPGPSPLQWIAGGLQDPANAADVQKLIRVTDFAVGSVASEHPSQALAPAADVPSDPDLALAHKLSHAGAVGIPDDLGTQQASASTAEVIIKRISDPYAFQSLVGLPAATSVTRLKSQGYIASSAEDDAHRQWPVDEEHPLPIIQDRLPEPSGNKAIARGLAVHKLLQLIDFRFTDTADALSGHLAQLVAQGEFTAAEAQVVDASAIVWLFSTPLGIKLRKAAVQPENLLRELPFLWSVPVTELGADDPTGVDLSNPADRPLVRGVIDVLLLEDGPPNAIGPSARQGHIIDYKTDAPEYVDARLEMYQRQLCYYARAVREILNIPITGGSLIFLTARHVQAVQV
ncbi:MAG: UvrD-helicase domain-containing protein [Phycisphaerales bacterium]|nr:UvrD-helicase domain-containing protein [Phycisphaerales bacterium]